MKTIKAIIILLVFFISISSNAQTLIGGSIHINASGNKILDADTTASKNKTNYINFSPFVGKFLSEKIALGISLNLSALNNSNGVNNLNRSNSFTIGAKPFIRYYAIKKNKISVFGVGSAGVDFTKSKIINGTTSSKNNSILASINVHPGISYSVTDKFSIETDISFINLGYSYEYHKYKTSKTHYSNFDFLAGLQGIKSFGNIMIGAIYKF